MPAPHYAISEAFIVLAALWAIWKLSKNQQYFGAIGVSLMGVAAALGVYRFGTGHITELADIHRQMGQYGGMVGMAFIALGLGLKTLERHHHQALIPIIIAIIFMCFLASIFKPNLTVPLFLIWSVIAIRSASDVPGKILIKKIGFASLAAIMLLNVIFIRQSPHLTPSLSWHLFHTLTAVWILGLVYIYRWRPEPNPRPS